MDGSGDSTGYVFGDVYSFGDLCPDLARRELLHVQAAAGSGLPAGLYAFLEFYCPRPDCDCRVVMWRVMFRGSARSAPAIVATLSWCWAEDDPHGPALEPAPQSRSAPALLDRLKLAIRDQGYGDVVKAHYAAVRSEARRRGSPVYALLHSKGGRPGPARR